MAFAVDDAISARVARDGVAAPSRSDMRDVAIIASRRAQKIAIEMHRRATSACRRDAMLRSRVRALASRLERAWQSRRRARHAHACRARSKFNAVLAACDKTAKTRGFYRVSRWRLRLARQRAGWPARLHGKREWIERSERETFMWQIGGRGFWVAGASRYADRGRQNTDGAAPEFCVRSGAAPPWVEAEVG
jgi:hypothetical protein